MKLYNFTNHSQSEWLEFFREYGFDEVTEPMHPEITPEMGEKEIARTVRSLVLGFEKEPKVLVQGMTNVCHYAVTFIQQRGGKAYYISTLRERDEHDRFVFRPVDLRKYIKIRAQRRPIQVEVHSGEATALFQ